MFSVKSCYWLARLGHIRTWQLHHGERELEVWRRVWSIPGPPKMVHFIWRACEGSLGVQERLFHRHIRDSPNCPICGEHQETICHAIFDCTQARAIWQVSAFSAFIAEVPRSFFDGSFEWLVNKVSRDELSVVCALMWAIWFCRNTFIFDSQTLGGVEVASNFVKMVREYGDYAGKVFRQMPSGVPSPTNWTPLLLGG